MDTTLYHSERNLNDWEHDTTRVDNTKQGTSKTGSTTPKRPKVETTTTEGLTNEGSPTKLEVQACRSDKRDKYVRGRRGHLKLMTEIPLDTLHEIFMQLDPLDLLNLSWASKSLRSIIMEKSGRYIWKQAYERLYGSENPPPPCPEDLNLAQYTRFLYHKRCMVCDTRVGHHTSWMMRLRACYHCLTNPDLFAICRYTSEGLLSIRSKKSSFVRRSEFEGVREGKGPSLNERHKLRVARMEGAREFDEWEERCAHIRNAELKQRKTERKNEIMKKLEEIGWKESYIKDLNSGSIPYDLPGFGIAKKLTKNDWKSIKPELMDYLSQLETQNLPRLHQRRLQTRWRYFETKFNEWDHNQVSPEWAFRPRAADISILEPFKSILFSPFDKNQPEDHFHSLIIYSEIDRVAKEWMKSRDEFILSLLPQDLRDLRDWYQGSEPGLPPLAILRFRGSCYGTIDYVCGSRENVLSNPPPLMELRDPRDRDVYEMLIKATTGAAANTNPSSSSSSSSSSSLGPWNWQEHDLIFDINACRVTIDLLQFLGMDPYTTTVSQTAQLGQMVLECFMCKNTWLPVNKFDLMVEHDLLCHSNAEEVIRLPVSERWIITEVVLEVDDNDDAVKAAKEREEEEEEEEEAAFQQWFYAK